MDNQQRKYIQYDVQRLNGSGWYNCLYCLRYSLALLKNKDTLWLHIWNELTQTAGHQLGYANMVGNTPKLTSITKVAANASSGVTVPGEVLYVPFEFWFKRIEPKSATPIKMCT